MKTEQAQLHEYNHGDCSSFPQKQQCDGSQPSVASAKDFGHPDKSQNASNNLLLNQYNCSNSTQYQIYLCDYQYDGHKWSVEIPATSFEDAQNRLKALSKGEIVGHLKLAISVPFKQGWVDWWRRWFNR